MKTNINLTIKNLTAEEAGLISELAENLTNDELGILHNDMTDFFNGKRALTLVNSDLSSLKDMGFAAALAADGHIAPPANNTFNPNPAQTNPPIAPINNVEVDGANLRWDARIHSSNKQKTGKGVWQKKRGVSDELIAQVETELRNTGAIANTQPPAGQQFMTSAPVNPQPAFNPAQFQQPAAPVNNGPVDFNAFLQRIGHLFSSGVVTQDYLTGLAQRVGQGFQVTVASIADISDRQDMVDYAVSIMKFEGKW